jgi:TRAP-type C4-dicarboxylate transport system substrate-binding protein
MKPTRFAALIALVLMTAVVVGCAVPAGADKAGALAGGPVVLKMAITSSGPPPPVADFIHRVRVLSGGSIQIRVMNQWGDYAPDDDAQVVHAVAAGTVDLGSTGHEVFDTIGVPGFQVLSVPMLIDSYPLENAVLKSGLTGPMLAELNRVHVTGLGVLGDGLRYPVAVRRPLLSPADWRGLAIGTYRSGVQEHAIDALGATPVVASGPYRVHYLATGAIQGFELDLQRYADNVPTQSARYVTGNVVLWPLFDVLFANPARLASLTAQQRTWLQRAAQEAAGNSVKLVAGHDNAYVKQVCALGARFATATPSDLVAMRGAFAPLDRQLETEPQTTAFVREIRQLKSATPPGPGLLIPARCAAG